MQQTLLALLALLIATLLSFNQQQSDVQNQGQVVRAEFEQMALGVAAESAQIIRSRAFDDATIGIPSDSIVPSSEFTSSFSSGNDCEPFGGNTTCDDVDDFHEMVADPVSFTFPQGEFDFTVEAEVRYVDEDLQPTGGTPSNQKQIILRVQDDSTSGGEPRLPEPIQYSEVVSYP